MSLDGCESESGLSDLIEEARQQIQVPDAPMCMYEDGPPTAVCTPLRPVLKLKTSDSVHVVEEQFRTPEMVPAVLENLSALRLDARTQEQSQAPVSAVPIGAAAASTSTAINESTTEEKNEEEVTALVNGERLGLADLKQSAFEAIQRGLSRDNIVKELFSDFTWRYPEVLQMEAGVFFQHCTEPTIQAAMSETFQDIAYGQLPHSSVVLDSLFKKFALETR
ncbi:hypothetical protein EIP86_003369 [Pleurotus ostreatoroseus]|nr:hypothetical protein EIP86_003369 [Pleurotus ostreatoroseus]